LSPLAIRGTTASRPLQNLPLRLHRRPLEITTAAKCTSTDLQKTRNGGAFAEGENMPLVEEEVAACGGRRGQR